MLVPSGSVRVLGGIRGGAESLESGDIGLRRRLASMTVSESLLEAGSLAWKNESVWIEIRDALSAIVYVLIVQVLSLLRNTDQLFSS